MTKLKDQATNIGPKTAYFTCILISTRFDLPFPCSLCVKVENKLVETLEEQLLPGLQKENYRIFDMKYTHAPKKGTLQMSKYLLIPKFFF